MKPSPKLIASLRWLLLGVASLATLFAVFIAEENWRGDRAWAAVERELKAKGERLEYRAILPPPVPDGQNFFKAPLLARVLYEPPSAEKAKILAETHLRDFYFTGHLGDGATTDLTALRDHLIRIHRLAVIDSEPPATGILNAFRPLQPLLDELRQAARQRPAAVLDSGSLPFEHPWLDTNVVLNLGQALALRASAELALGRTDDAFEDTFATLRFANNLTAQSYNLMGLLIGEATLSAATRPIAEGRQRHVWTEAQLATFQRLLLELHPLNAFKEAICAIRTASLQIIDAMPAVPPTLTPDHFSWPLWLFHGWAQQNKVAVCLHLDEDALATFTVSPERIFHDRVEHAQQSIHILEKSRSPYEWVAQRGLLRNIVSLLEGLGHTADSIVEAATACALERHRLAHGRDPEKLDELVPALLPAVPTGIFDGQPLRYIKLPQGGHRIYSSGPNGRDDAGKGDDIVLQLPDAS